MTGSVVVFVGGAAVAVGVMLALLGARRGQAAGPPPRWRRTVRDRVVGDPARARIVMVVAAIAVAADRVVRGRCGGVVGDGLAGGRAGGVGHRAVGAVADGLRPGHQ